MSIAVIRHYVMTKATFKKEAFNWGLLTVSELGLDQHSRELVAGTQAGMALSSSWNLHLT